MNHNIKNIKVMAIFYSSLIRLVSSKVSAPGSSVLKDLAFSPNAFRSENEDRFEPMLNREWTASEEGMLSS